VRLTWSDSSDETSYHLYRRSELEGWSLIAELPANAVAYTDAGLQAGIAYTYRIGAVNAAGEQVSDVMLIQLPTPYQRWADLWIEPENAGSFEDASGDGLWNELVFMLGLDPTQNNRGALSYAFEEVYAAVGDYLTLSFELNANVAADRFIVETSSDLAGDWVESVRIGSVEVDGVTQVKYRSAKTLEEASSQFIRVRSVSD